jgi:hypothetical protein
MTISRIASVLGADVREVSNVSTIDEPNAFADIYIVDNATVSLYSAATADMRGAPNIGQAPVTRICNARVSGAVEVREPDNFTVICTLATRYAWVDLLWYSGLWHPIAQGS